MQSAEHNIQTFDVKLDFKVIDLCLARYFLNFIAYVFLSEKKNNICLPLFFYCNFKQIYEINIGKQIFYSVAEMHFRNRQLFPLLLNENYEIK